jgi:hypothetical protein
MTHTTYRILSCDGGGIRGVITAKLLQALDPSVIKNIDLFAGTSTASSPSVSRAEFRSIRSSNCTARKKPARRSSSPICLWPSRTGSVGHLRLANSAHRHLGSARGPRRHHAGVTWPCEPPETFSRRTGIADTYWASRDRHQWVLAGHLASEITLMREESPCYH